MSERTILFHLLNIRAGLDEEAICMGNASNNILGTRASSLEADVIWRTTSPSSASRRPSLRGRVSVRGALVDRMNGRELVFESRLERGLAEMLMARRDIRAIIDQPPAVKYTTADGRTRSHTFDFLAITTNGIRLAIAVKPAATVERSGIQETLDRIREQVGPRFADAYLLRTNQHITPDRIYNAGLILRSRRCRNESDIDTVWAIVGNLAGSFRAADVVMHSKLGARGFSALVCLVDDARLEPVAGRIGYLTSLRRVSGQ
ncbi:MAG: hypothetical protein BGO92_04955 [Magnetospirillum sp. 64-120]|uniref:hypothetical protein n=1 Tax=Magnetospirillum sp. 64-120 TaxID=1895778 RepID=UPI0009269B31|nr:hypothetical protein [Magnetospirillum sp. 64-120]OJX82928.1 MAG: hypothetical protein BGO92_04955 [Magnetospirillum sp. 64-120]